MLRSQVLRFWSGYYARPLIISKKDRGRCCCDFSQRQRPSTLRSSRRNFSTFSIVGNDLVTWDVQPLMAAPLSSSSSSSGTTEADTTTTTNKFVGTLTLNSPSNLNALTVELGRAFESVVRQVGHDLQQNRARKHTTAQGHPPVDVVVLQGAGDVAFSAGGDLEWLQSLRHNTVHENADAMGQFYHSFLCLRRYIPVPVIAALHGPAMGAGAGLALACDLRTAAPRLKILGLHFTQLGIHTGMGASHYLPQAIQAGSAIINEILLAGKILSGQECYQLGLVNRLDDDAKGAAYQLAAEVVGHAHPLAVRTVLQTLRRNQDVGLELALQREAWAQAACYAREDWGEGVRAVAEKRPPVFDPYHPHDPPLPASKE